MYSLLKTYLLLSAEANSRSSAQRSEQDKGWKWHPAGGEV